MSLSGKTSLEVESFNIPGVGILFGLKHWEIKFAS